jgi:hypothetical protein
MSNGHEDKITDILANGDVADGHRSRDRANKLLPEFKRSLSLPVTADPTLDPALEDFLIEVVLGAAWYERSNKRAKRGLWKYVLIQCALVVGIPLGLIVLSHLAPSTTTGAIASQIAGFLTGILALQKTLSTWYASQQRYAVWFKSASDLKTIYYTLLQSWNGGAGAHSDALLVALKSGTNAARQIITNEQYDYFQRLALPSFDVLDMLTSTKANVSSLVTNLLPGASAASVSAVGKNALLSTVQLSVPPAADAGRVMPSATPAATMFFSAHSLHHSVISESEHKTVITERFASIISERSQVRPMAASSPEVIQIPLTTVSLNSFFDAYINVLFTGADQNSPVPMIVDSGNSTLIVPSWDAIAALPNSTENYTVLGTGTEPWGAPANIVQGPINLQTTTGAIYTIHKCIFYACTGNGPNGQPTANFGAGCLSPWAAGSANTPTGANGTIITMQAPLSYDSAYPFAEFNYEASSNIFGSSGGVPNVSTGSHLTLYKTRPNNYTMCAIIPGIAWMALIPKGLGISGIATKWPGDTPSPIAMIDTGGGPVYLSDPAGYVYKNQWPDQVTNPAWTSTSTNCQSVNDPVSIELVDADGVSVSYTIDPSNLPPSVQGLSLVMCQTNAFMMGENGMNIGGISALVNRILVDYARAQVGLQPK